MTKQKEKIFQINWIKKSDGSFKRDKFGQRVYEISEGENEKINPTELHYSLNRNRLDNVGECTYLIIEFIVTCHKSKFTEKYKGCQIICKRG